MGISKRIQSIPTNPIIVPKMMFPKTMQKHIPTPKIKAPIIPNTVSAIIV